MSGVMSEEEKADIVARVEADPNLELGREGPHWVIAVGYFAEDDTDVHCTHGAIDIDGAEQCAEALRKEGHR
jgi:hypothetical protein